MSALLEAAAGAGGHRLLTGGQGAIRLVAREPGNDTPLGLVEARRDGSRWALEVVTDPRSPAGLPVWARLLAESVEVVKHQGGGPVQTWVHGAEAEHDELARAAGLDPERNLYQMRRPLPLDEAATLPTRPFVVGQDEAAWLEVNNRAFADHPDQGGWTLERLEELESEPWFDPEGFLVHERDGRLAGFCWTKVHAWADPAVGELFVLAVDPHHQGLGLGRQLVVAGCQWLAAKGLGTAILYVDVSNRPAVRIYETLGFRLHHVDRSYVGVVPPISDPRA